MSMPATDVRPVAGWLSVAYQAAIIFTGALAGAILATWLTEASLAGSSELWIAYHQAITPAYTRVLPPTGALALIAALAALAPSWRNPLARWLILAAVGCLIIGFVVTVVVHFPINAELMTWRPAAPPADWPQLRDRWLAAHAIRAVFAVAAFAMLVIAGSGSGGHAAAGADRP